MSRGWIHWRGMRGRNDVQSVDQRESEETQMGICQPLVSFRAKGETLTNTSFR